MSTLRTINVIHPSGSTTNIVNDSSGNVTVGNDLTVTGATVPSSSFKRNRIINGNMLIDQRNAGASVSITSSPFTLDRWAAQVSTGGSVQQITSTISGFYNSLKFTSSASNSFFQMGQQIEYQNCYDLQNATVTISFYAKANNSNSGSTALTVRTRTGAAINGAIRFSGTASDTSVTITTSAARYTVTKALPSTFGALSLEFVLGSNVSGDGFEITGVQLEVGTKATPYEMQIYSDQLAQCQRYYQQLQPEVASASSTEYYYSNSVAGEVRLPLTVVMRTSPTASTLTQTNGAISTYSGALRMYTTASGQVYFKTLTAEL